MYNALFGQTIMNIHQSNGTVIQIPTNTIDSITFTMSNTGNLATISTTAISSITGSSAISGGNITNDGGSLVTQRGVCWSTSPSPTTANSFTSNGSGTGSFLSNLSGLTVNTIYYVRAYAVNSAGISYGNELSFLTSPNGSIVSNPGPGVTFDGYTYSTIILGNGQEWMSENLRTSIYANGDPIPNVTDSLIWPNLTTGAWCHYGNNNIYESPHGKLYNWYAASDNRNACPNGWHVSTDTDWNKLVKYIDNSADTTCLSCSQSTIAGGILKTIGSQYWNSNNINSTNLINFSAVSGGLRAAPSGTNCYFYNFQNGYLWTSTDFNSISGISRYLYPGNSVITRTETGKYIGFSIRCVKD